MNHLSFSFFFKLFSVAPPTDPLKFYIWLFETVLSIKGNQKWLLMSIKIELTRSFTTIIFIKKLFMKEETPQSFMNRFKNDVVRAYCSLLFFSLKKVSNKTQFLIPRSWPLLRFGRCTKINASVKGMKPVSLSCFSEFLLAENCSHRLLVNCCS